MCIPTIRELPYMTDFLKIAKSIVVHFAHICAYGVETVNCSLLMKLEHAMPITPHPNGESLLKAELLIFPVCNDSACCLVCKRRW